MKRNFTKILSLLLMLTALCSLVFAMSIIANAASSDTIYINNIAIKNGQHLMANATAVTTTRPRNNYAYYNDGVLYLHNFSLKSATSGINAGDGDLIVSLTGTSTIPINSSSSSASDAAIVTKGRLTIRGDGSLNINNSAGLAINCGNLTVDSGTLNVKSKNGIGAAQGDIVVNGGKVYVNANIGVVCKNILVYGGCLDVVGTYRTLNLAGRISAANGLYILAAEDANYPLDTYNAAQSSVYERVFVGDHECYGSYASCQTPMTCGDCGRVFDFYAAHEWTKTWDVTTAEGHAHKCKTKGCTATTEPETHTPGAAATETSDQTCTTCGYIITPKLEHTHTVTKFAATKPTCDKNGNIEYYVCSGCSKIFKDSKATKEYTDLNSVILAPTGHQYAEVWSMDESGHWHACTACGASEDKVNHTPGAEATLTTDQTCSVCGFVIKKADAHTHDFGEHWFGDDSGHWHACACGEVSEKAAHADTDGDQLCDSCGWTVEGTIPTEEPIATEGTEPEKEPTEKPEDDQGGIPPMVIVVCILGVILLGMGAVLVVILVKSKKQ